MFEKKQFQFCELIYQSLISNLSCSLTKGVNATDVKKRGKTCSKRIHGPNRANGVPDKSISGFPGYTTYNLCGLSLPFVHIPGIRPIE